MNTAWGITGKIQGMMPSDRVIYPLTRLLAVTQYALDCDVYTAQNGSLSPLVFDEPIAD